MKVTKKKGICISIVCIIILSIFILFLLYPSVGKVKNSVVKVEVYDHDGTLISTGSGFCAFESNYIVTNYHVMVLIK